MLDHFSWTTYCEAVVLFLIFYYGFIGFRYFPDELKSLVKQPSRPEQEAYEYQSGEPSLATFEPEPFAATSEESFDDVEELIGRIKSLFADPAVRLESAPEFTGSVRLILKDFPNLKNSHFAPAICELVATECAKNKTIQLSEEEVSELWSNPRNQDKAAVPARAVAQM